GVLLVVAGAAARFDIELHQALGHELNHLAQHIDVGSLLGKLGQCHSGGGHRGNLLEHGWWVAPQPYPGPRWPPLAGWRHSSAASRYAVVGLTPLPGTSTEPCTRRLRTQRGRCLGPLN